MTNELQLSLLALGVLVVAGVFAHSKWQEMKHRKRAEQLFRPPEADVLMEGGDSWADSSPDNVAVQEHFLRRRKTRKAEEDIPESRREPTLGDPENAPLLEAEMQSMLDTAWESELEEPLEVSPEPAQFGDNWSDEASSGQEPDASEDWSGSAQPRELLFSGIDAIVAFDLAEPAQGEWVMASQQEILRQIEKPILWTGFNEAEGFWERARKNGAYRRWQVGLQLADRSGPLGGNEFLLFTRAMQRLAGELMTVVRNMPACQQALEQARQLDRFCEDMDIQIGINLTSQGAPFPGTKIRALAESAGMVLGADGFYTRSDDEGRVLFALSNAESERGFVAETIRNMRTSTLLFLLDVPRAPQGRLAFKQMLVTARSFARTLSGTLEDDNGRPLSEDQLNRIGEEHVARTQATLEAAGLSAGGSLALRLFN